MPRRRLRQRSSSGSSSSGGSSGSGSVGLRLLRRLVGLLRRLIAAPRRAAPVRPDRGPPLAWPDVPEQSERRGGSVIKGFREFILRGNVIDLAVAVVIGAAFTAIVNSIVANLINPLIGALFRADSLDNALVISIPTLDGQTADVRIGAVHRRDPHVRDRRRGRVLRVRAADEHAQGARGGQARGGHRRRGRSPRTSSSCSARSATCSPSAAAAEPRRAPASAPT